VLTGRPAAGGLRALLALVSTVVFVDTMFYAAIAPLLPAFSDDLGLSKAEAGMLAGAYAAGTFAGALPGGVLAARAGVKPAVLLGLALMSASSVAFGLAGDVLVLDAARFVQGIGGACSWAGAMAWLVGAAPADRRGALLGTALGAAVGGSLFGPVLGGAAEGLGRAPVFGGFAAAGVALALVAARLPAAPPQPVALGGVPRALRDRRVAAGLWLTALAGAMYGTVGVLGPLRLDALGAGTLAVAGVFLLAAGLEALVAPLAGRLSDRRGRLAPVRAALPVAVVLALLLPVPGAAWLLAALVLAYAPAVGVIWAPAMALLADGADDRGLDQGLAFAFLNLTWALGQVAGSSGGGALAGATADAVSYALTATLAAVTLAGVWRADRPAVVR
jgi:MFS family permease